MGKKGNNVTQERPQSAQELGLMETQNQQLAAGIAIAREQEDRSREQYQNWQSSYEPMETGMIKQGATRENGYSDPSMAQSDSRNLLFKSRQAEQNKYNGGGVYQSRGGEAPVGQHSSKRNGKGA